MLSYTTSDVKLYHGSFGLQYGKPQNISNDEIVSSFFMFKGVSNIALTMLLFKGENILDH